MMNGKIEEITRTTRRLSRYAGILAVMSTMILLAGAQEAVAGPNPGPGDDPAVKEAVEEFDQAQSDATAAAPSNRTSKGLEDKLDEAIRNQEEVDDDPAATDQQKDDASAATDKARDDADFHNGRVKDPDAAEDYREKLERRREARKELIKQKRRWMAARSAPRTAARALRLINSRLELANERPPSSQQIGRAATDAEAVALLDTRDGALPLTPTTAPEHAPGPSPSLADFQEIRDALTLSQQQPYVFVPDVDPHDSGSRSRDDAARLLNGLMLQREYDRDRPRNGERVRPRHDERELAGYREPTPTQLRDPEPVRHGGYPRSDEGGLGGRMREYELRQPAAHGLDRELEYRHR